MPPRKKESKAVTKEATAMGEALQKAGFKAPAEPAGPEVDKLMAYEVVFSYEAGSGKRYTQSSIVADCRNAQDAQKAITEEIKKRGLDPERIEFTETIERPELQKEAVIEAPLAAGEPELFPEPERKAASEIEDAPPAHRLVQFCAKIATVQIKNGDTRLLTIQLHVGTDIPRVSSELLDKFRGSEHVVITVEPAQLDAMIDTRKPAPAPAAQPEKPEPEEAAHYICPHCGQTVHKTSETEKEIKCPFCDKTFPIEFDDVEDPTAPTVTKEPAPAPDEKP